MKLKKSLFTSLTILALALPVTSGAFFAFSASPAMAKGGKDKGGSDRGSRGDRGRSDRDKASRGGQGRGGSSAGARGSGKGPGNGLGKGQAAAPRPAKATTASVDPELPTDGLDLHPSQLGSMNGALNANINAVLAHIRNGNTNGPVGALAGLAVADHEADGAQDLIETAAQFDALETALADAGFETLEDYEDAGESIAAVEEALAALGEAAGGEAPNADDIAAAEAALEALGDAETAIIEAWNKSDAATDDEKAALLDALRDRLEEAGDLIGDAIETTETTEGQDEGEGEGDTGDVSAGLDPETRAMIDGLKF